jgi:glutathione synthase/RimK-type ligase-like ATP-grasp enzyme
MPKIGIVYGMESSFPSALVDRINGKQIPGVLAEHIRLGEIRMAEPSGYAVIIDRISHAIEFYRAYLKNAALGGTAVINNPFFWSADDKFFNYALASQLGIAVPRTAILPQKMHPPGTTAQSMRNLKFPLNWEEIFEYVGFPAFLKPLSGGAWKHHYEVASPHEFFEAYDQTGSMCMCLQATVKFEECFRCYVIGQEKVRVMPYDPKQPHHLRYAQTGKTVVPSTHDRIVNDALTLCRTLGYDFNAVEFAVQDGVPYAIDLLDPAPDADVHSLGDANFEWIVENMAQLAIDQALAFTPGRRPALLPWGHFMKSKSKAASSNNGD